MQTNIGKTNIFLEIICIYKHFTVENVLCRNKRSLRFFFFFLNQLWWIFNIFFSPLRATLSLSLFEMSQSIGLFIVVVGDEWLGEEKVLGVASFELELRLVLGLSGIEEDKELVGSWGFVEVRKRETRWLSRWITPDLNRDWKWSLRSDTRSESSDLVVA